MSFVKKIQDLHAKLTDLGSEFEKAEQKYNKINSMVNSAESAVTKNTQEINRVKTELNTKYTSIESRLPVTATIDREGIVTLSKFETLNTDGNKVITANVLKTVLDNLVDYIPEASTEQLGLIKIAKAEDINTESNSVIGVSTLDEIKQPVDISNFRQKGKTKQGLNYFVDVYNKDFKTMNMFGTITISSTSNRIELPVSILPDSLGIVITPINSTEVVYPATVDKNYIELVVPTETETTQEEEETGIRVSVSITCCIKPVPVANNVEVSLDEDSDEVELSWNVGEE